MSFYIYLPSNSNMITRPENKGGDFEVDLSETLFLDSSWEVGLVEFIYRKDWPNISQTDNIIQFEYLGRDNRITPEFINRVWRPLLFKQHNARFTVDGKEEYPIPLLPPTGLLFDELLAHIEKAIKVYVPDFSLTRSKIKKDEVCIYSPSVAVTVNKELNEMVLLNSLIEQPSHENKGKKKGYICWNVNLDDWPDDKWKGNIQKNVFTLPEGYYANKTDFLTYLQQMFLTIILPGDQLTLENIHGGEYARLKYTPGNDQSKVWWRIGMSKGLCDMLGFQASQLNTNNYYYIQPVDNPSNPETAPYDSLQDSEASHELIGAQPIDLGRNVDTLWIYTDIIVPQITGNKTAPILRIVPAQGKYYGETVLLEYDEPHYLSLVHTTISTIAIKIYDTHGLVPIPFPSDVVLKLHFRKKKDTHAINV